MVAALLVGSLTIHMWRSAKTIKANIEAHLESSSRQAGWAALLGIFAFTVLMISREGIETALLMASAVAATATATR